MMLQQSIDRVFPLCCLKLQLPFIRTRLHLYLLCTSNSSTHITSYSLFTEFQDTSSAEPRGGLVSISSAHSANTTGGFVHFRFGGYFSLVVHQQVHTFPANLHDLCFKLMLRLSRSNKAKLVASEDYSKLAWTLQIWPSGFGGDVF